tara:strand:- start:65382 stop:65891 length:510 start_codon:yes stop_codon:yes gene_type:complete
MNDRPKRPTKSEIPKIIRPPRLMANKVKKSGGPSAEQAIMRALNAADDLMDSYQGWAVDDLTKLWRTFQASPRGMHSPEDIAQMFEISHGIRGEGGSFGFPLISTICDSLCKLLEAKERLALTELEIVKVHIMAMRAVFNQHLKGPQLKLERELRQLLTLLRDRAGKRH